MKLKLTSLKLSRLMTIGVHAMTRRSVAAALQVVQPLCQIIRCNGNVKTLSSKVKVPCPILWDSGRRSFPFSKPMNLSWTNPKALYTEPAHLDSGTIFPLNSANYQFHYQYRHSLATV